MRFQPRPGRGCKDSRRRRRLWRLLWVALAAPFVIAAGAALWLYQSLPQLEGSLAVTGIGAPVAIERDSRGVPTIRAASERDAYFALGFTHAQDRLFQMETMRMVALGRLSEVIGPSGLSTDRMMRLLNARGQAEAAYGALGGPERAILAAYAAGVNAYLEQRDGPLPLEFVVGRHVPEPWQPLHSLLWAPLMGPLLTGNWRGELQRLRLQGRLTPAQIEELWGQPEGSVPTTLAGLIDPGVLDRIAAALPPTGGEGASNEWVLDGSRTESGRPLLANDPHLQLGAPSQWYLARIEAGEHRRIGAFVPGVPVMILGHNGHLAWGFTTTNADVWDLFVERVDPEDGRRYMTPEGPRPFAIREEVMRVRGQPDVTMTVRETRHGVVIDDVVGGAAGTVPAGHVLALAHPNFFEADTTASALLAAGAARDVDTFRTALRRWHMPMQNIVFADVAGRIGFAAPGLIPIRRSGDGWMPTAGWTGETDWDGFVSPDDLPHASAAPDGTIVNANNRVVPPDFPVFISRDWDAPYRAERIAELLARRPRHGITSMVAVQNDPLSTFARHMLPLLTAVTAPDARATEALEMLRRWDGTAGRERPEPLIFNAWMRALHGLLLGPLADEMPELKREMPELLRRAAEGRSTFCTAESDAPRGCRTLIRAALGQAVADLTTRHGSDMTRWRWGSMHYAPFAHAVLSRVPVIGEWVGFKVATDGDFYTVNRGAGRFSDPANPFAHSHGAGFRAVYDLADLDRSVFMVAPGQSGNPLSRHYGDLAQPWADGQMIAIPGRAGADARILRLTPGG